MVTKGPLDFEYDFLTDRLFFCRPKNAPFQNHFHPSEIVGQFLWQGGDIPPLPFSFHFIFLVRPRPSIFSLSIELKAESFLRIFCKEYSSRLMISGSLWLPLASTQT